MQPNTNKSINNYFAKIPRYGRYYYTLGIYSYSRHSFIFKNESYLDRFFKWLGFSKELQLEDDNFNKKIYIINDCRQFHYDLYHNTKLQSLIMRLFDLGVRTVECSNFRLFVTFKYYAIKNDSGKFREQVLLILQEIDEILQILPSQSSYNLFFPTMGIWYSFIKIIGFALPFGIISILMGFFDNNLLYDGMFKYSLCYSIPISTACVAFTIKKFLHTSKAHHIIVPNILIVLPSLILWIYVSMCYVNEKLDTSVPEVRHSVIIKKDKLYRNIGGTHYRITVEITEPNFIYEFDSNQNFYDLIKVGTVIELKVRSGRLGYPWVDNNITVLK